jgi:hypothetical protein
MAQGKEVIWVRRKRKYFCEKGWTGKSLICFAVHTQLIGPVRWSFGDYSFETATTDIPRRSRNVRYAPMNETARAVGRCGVGRGRASNGWSDRASYVTWRRRTKEHPQA